jgi:hypothetical protein
VQQAEGIIKAVTDDKEKSFLVAFEGKMYEIQQEMRALRDKADKAKLEQKMDAKL